MNSAYKTDKYVYVKTGTGSCENEKVAGCDEASTFQKVSERTIEDWKLQKKSCSNTIPNGWTN